VQKTETIQKEGNVLNAAGLSEAKTADAGVVREREASEFKFRQIWQIISASLQRNKSVRRAIKSYGR